MGKEAEAQAPAAALSAAAAPASERQPPRAHRAPTARARAHALRAAAAAAVARAQLGEWVQFLNTVMAQHARARPENGGGSAAPATAAGGGAAPGFASGASADPEVVASIRDILPHLSQERVRHALEAHDGNFDRTLEYLMTDAPDDSPAPPPAVATGGGAAGGADAQVSVEQLAEIFPDRSRDELVRSLAYYSRPLDEEHQAYYVEA